MNTFSREKTKADSPHNRPPSQSFTIKKIVLIVLTLQKYENKLDSPER